MNAREFFTFAQLHALIGRIVAYGRSFFDDPKAPGKGSMARLCALIAMTAGIWTTVKTVQFAFAVLAGNKGETGALGILAGLATTLFATVCVGLLKRTTAAGVTETIDDAPSTREMPAVQMTTQTTVQPQGGGPTP
jgi:hypothetical protein